MSSAHDTTTEKPETTKKPDDLFNDLRLLGGHHRTWPRPHWGFRIQEEEG